MEAPFHLTAGQARKAVPLQKVRLAEHCPKTTYRKCNPHPELRAAILRELLFAIMSFRLSSSPCFRPISDPKLMSSTIRGSSSVYQHERPRSCSLRSTSIAGHKTTGELAILAVWRECAYARCLLPIPVECPASRTWTEIFGGSTCACIEYAPVGPHKAELILQPMACVSTADEGIFN